MVISPGAVVGCRWTGRTAWVAKRLDPSGKWRLVPKQIHPTGQRHLYLQDRRCG
jgi:hypothetical protein